MNANFVKQSQNHCEFHHMSAKQLIESQKFEIIANFIKFVENNRKTCQKKAK